MRRAQFPPLAFVVVLVGALADFAWFAADHLPVEESVAPAHGDPAPKDRPADPSSPVPLGSSEHGRESTPNPVQPSEEAKTEGETLLESPDQGLERRLREAIAAARIDSNKWRHVRTKIERAIIEHTYLDPGLALTFDAISESPGLQYQELSRGLLNGLRTRSNSVMDNTDDGTAALLRLLLATRSAKIWYLMGNIVCGAFAPNPPDALLAHMESLLLEGFDPDGQPSAAGSASTHTLNAYLVLTDDVQRTLRIVGLSWNTSKDAWTGTRGFLTSFLQTKFLSGKVDESDFSAALTFFPTYTAYTLANIERIPGKDMTESLESRRNDEEEQFQDLWQMLQPADAADVRNALGSLCQGPLPDEDRALLERLVPSYDKFRAEYLAGNVERPKWPPDGFTPWR
jgi:hypothetical protein